MRELLVSLRVALEALVGFLAGASFAMSLVLGTAAFYFALLGGDLSSSRFEWVLDFVAAPTALAFALFGAVLGVLRVRADVRTSAALARDRDGDAQTRLPARSSPLRPLVITFAILFALAIGLWPVLLARQLYGADPPLAYTLTSGAILVVIGLSALIAWRANTRSTPSPRPAPTTTSAAPGQRYRSVRAAPLALTVATFAIALLIGGGVLANVADWHPLLLVFAGLPLTLMAIGAYVFGAFWLLRPWPDADRARPHRP